MVRFIVLFFLRLILFPLIFAVLCVLGVVFLLIAGLGWILAGEETTTTLTYTGMR
jgi:hypothetical protein